MVKLAEPYVLSINPYIPSQPMDHRNSWAILASNENCLGPSPLALKAAQDCLKQAHLYPTALRHQVLDALCEHFMPQKIKPSNIALGNGSSELIVNLVRALVSPNEAVLFPTPSFVLYRLAARVHGREEAAVSVDEHMHYDLQAMNERILNKNKTPIKLIFLSNPNNPTGTYINKNELDLFINSLPSHIVLVIDEAYFEYVTEKDYPNSISYALKRPRTLILRTFSKAYGLAGLRMGYAVGDEEVISILCRIRDPYNVNIAAQQAAIAALGDKNHVEKSIEHNIIYKPILLQGLKEAGFKVFDSVGNFILSERQEGMPKVDELCQELFKKGIVIRGLKDFGLSEHVRVSVGKKEELDQLFKGLDEVLRKK